MPEALVSFSAPDFHVLTINAGSSSLKAKVYRCDGENLSLDWQTSLIGIGSADLPDHRTALTSLCDCLAAENRIGRIEAVGHRIVHGGEVFTRPTRITAEIAAALAELIPLAPHHQPHNLAAIEIVANSLPGVPQVACFDTAFHATLPPEARELGLPAAYTDRGIRRYGFHGLSYQSLIDGFQRTTGEPPPTRLVALHLGNGASLCAIHDLKSVATSMGFSTLDGIPMGTRSGALDPGALIHLMKDEGLSAGALEDLLYNRCGLLGLSGESGDVKTLLASQSAGARRALSFFTYRIAREVGALAVALGGIDGLAFTGGIGENAAPVRAMILKRCAWLGVNLDDEANRSNATKISAKGSVSAWIIPAAEEEVIARQTLATLTQNT